MIVDDFGNQVPSNKAREIVERLDAGDMRMAAIETDLSANTKATQELASGVREIVEFFTTMKGAFRVLNWLGNLAKPLAAIIGMGLAVWSAYLAYRNGIGGHR